MPKHGKTRKQKILADSRRQTLNQNRKDIDLTTYSIANQVLDSEKIDKPSSTDYQIKNTKIHVSTTNYQYLTKDLQKTFLLTCSVIIFEVLIKYFINPS